MASSGSLRVTVQVDTHGALGDGRIGVARRTVALWLIAAAQWILRARIDIYCRKPWSTLRDAHPVTVAHRKDRR